MNEQLSLFEEEIPHVLMSLREEYYNEILNGNKHFEYRTRYLKNKSIAYIYISKTKKCIVAKIKFGKPIIGEAHEIALIANQENPGCYQEMLNYFSHGIGYALPIEDITIINEIKLDNIRNEFPSFVAPQSYYILDKKIELLEYLEMKEGDKKCVRRK